MEMCFLHQNKIWQVCWNYQDQEFNATMISTLRALIDKADNMQPQMGNISRVIEILRTQMKY